MVVSKQTYDPTNTNIGAAVAALRASGAQVVVSFSIPAFTALLKLNSLKELFDLARREPGKLNWAGMTGAFDFLFEGWLKGENIDIKKVPYRNPVEAATDLAENRVQIFEGAYAIIRPHLQSGNIKVLAVVSSSRDPAHPEIPTVAEARQILKLADRVGAARVAEALRRAARYGAFDHNAVARIVAGKPVKAPPGAPEGRDLTAVCRAWLPEPPAAVFR